MNEKCRLVETDPLEDDQMLRRNQCAELEILAAMLGSEGTPDLLLLATSLREIARRRAARPPDRGASPPPIAEP